MVGNVNKVILVGKLVSAPVIRNGTQPGKLFASFDMLTSESWHDRSGGEQRERADVHHIEVFNEQIVEVAFEYLHKGSQVYIEGHLRYRPWQDHDGRQHPIGEIVLSQYRGKLVLLDRRPDTPNPFEMIFAEMMLHAAADRRGGQS